MGKLVMTEEGAPATPSAGIVVPWCDNVLPGLFAKDDTGRVWGRTHRASVASQGAGFASDTYVTNSGMLVGSFGVQAQTIFEWQLSASKTAAGVATPIYIIG